MTSRRFRFIPFTIAQDLTAWPEYAAQCVSGDESDCGEKSGWKGHPDGVEKWMKEHTRQTLHLRYRRLFADYAEFDAPEDFDPSKVIRGETIEHSRALDAPRPALALERARATP
ncbi:hypothetical protein [Streptomyces blastmyceticus]|uniref:DUF7848 domain-containing protein n=1 Tax=Streptomyces blastmyceticus TaxID=68180 RepID=A0ABN0Y3V0_9ACTN